jgi:hypothetical protein
MGDVLIVTVVLGAAMLIFRQLREKHFQAPNLVGMALLIVLSVGVTRVIPKFHKPNTPGAIETMGQDNGSPDGVQTTGLAASEAPSSYPSSGTVARVVKLRQRFVFEAGDASSNIDSKVQLTSAADLIHYLPRAAMIGFFAPFPKMWLATGNHVGSAGRRLSGLETMAMYVVEGLALVGLLSSRGSRRFSVWLLWLVAAVGLTSLGLVVVNVGTLYRLRYIFLILLIILAAEGAAHTFGWDKKKRSDASKCLVSCL